MLVGASAFAHPALTSAVLLELRGERLDVELQLPLDQLQIARERPLPPGPLSAADEDALRAYLLAHVHVDAPTEGNARVLALHVEAIDGAAHLLASMTFAVPAGTRQLTLRANPILHRVVTHKLFVSVQKDFEGGMLSGSEPVGVLRYQHDTLVVDRGAGSRWRGARAVFLLGAHHIAEGTDHLLFLLTLLLAAPLVAVGRRWTPDPTVRGPLRRILTIVTAFTLGHSATLAVATFGAYRFPTRPIEVLVAASILVSAAHAIRPLFPRREGWIAAGFGLVHGLAFASTLLDLGYDTATRATTLLAFNLGIEAMQLALVALVLPVLLWLRTRRAYSFLRIALAAGAMVAAAVWTVQRVLA